MKRPELYEKTVNILKEAYFNDTLRHTNCYACAVGNMVVANSGDKYLSGLLWENDSPRWDEVFCTNGVFGQSVHEICYTGEAKRQIDCTGYTWQELAKIEYAFETAPKGDSEDEWMFLGLCAVIDALDQIHENNDTKITSSNKAKFCKA